MFDNDQPQPDANPVSPDAATEANEPHTDEMPDAPDELIDDAMVQEDIAWDNVPF